MEPAPRRDQTALPAPLVEGARPHDAAAIRARLALGLAGMVVRALSGAAPAEARRPQGLLTFGFDVCLGLGFAVERRLTRATAPVLGRMARVASPARTWLQPWQQRGRLEQRQNMALAERFAERLLAQVVVAVLEQVDMNEIIDRLDVGRVIDRVDVDAIAGRVDVGSVVDRVDLNAVAERIDVNGIAERVDLQAIIERLDLPKLTRDVLEAAEVDDVIRRTTHGLAGESVDALRVQGMSADGVVSRVVDRVLRRHTESEP